VRVAVKKRDNRSVFGYSCASQSPWTVVSASRSTSELSYSNEPHAGLDEAKSHWVSDPSIHVSHPATSTDLVIGPSNLCHHTVSRQCSGYGSDWLLDGREFDSTSPQLVLGWVTGFTGGGQTTSVFHRAIQANSASYPQLGGKWVPAKVQRCSAVKAGWLFLDLYADKRVGGR